MDKENEITLYINECVKEMNEGSESRLMVDVSFDDNDLTFRHGNYTEILQGVLEAMGYKIKVKKTYYNIHK